MPISNKPINGVSVPRLHFGAYTIDSLLVGIDENNPTYLTGLNLFATSSPEFALITGADGELWVRNDSTRTFSMQGTATYQTNQGAGGAAEIYLWSERSSDDGVTFLTNTFSLRTNDVRNNSANSQTKSSAVESWAPGESIRWAMYNTGGGTITLAAPAATVNNGEGLEGLSFYWQLNEV